MCFEVEIFQDWSLFLERLFGECAAHDGNVMKHQQ
jgi:hypothetical protein